MLHKLVVTTKTAKRNRLEDHHTVWFIVEHRGPLSSPAKSLVSTDTDLLTNLAQSCKPAAVGMRAYSSSVNICSTERLLAILRTTSNNFWPIRYMHEQQSTKHTWGTVTVQSEKNLWSTFKISP